MFLTAHLTLSHWPYSWRDSPVKNGGSVEGPEPVKAKADEPRPTWPGYYLDVVKRTDRQFADLMAILERKGVLRNAIVVVYSDHGESFGYKSELLAPADSSAMTALGEIVRWGHGTSVLTPQQYHTVLAVRGYGAARFGDGAARQYDAPVAVYDIAPTIAELLAVKSRDGYEGKSLAPLLRDEPDAAASFAGRVRFTETEFTPTELATPAGAISASVLDRVAAFYTVDKVTDRLELRRAFLGEVTRFRHYAAVGPTLVLAAIPSNEGFRYLYVDNKGGSPTGLSGPPQANAPAEVRQLWDAMHGEYGALLLDSGKSPDPLATAHADTQHRGVP